MDRPNSFILDCTRHQAQNINKPCVCCINCREDSVRTIQNHQSAQDMIDVNDRLISFLDGHLDLQWENTLMTVFNGYALYKKVTSWNSGSSFGRSLNHYPGCQHLQGPAKKQLTKKISLIKNVYENIDDIIVNVTHQDMSYVDIRKLSVRELAEARDFSWVKRYNAVHAPGARKRKGAPIRAYQQQHVDSIVDFIESTGIAEYVNYDPDQLRLLGRDVIEKMLKL